VTTAEAIAVPSYVDVPLPKKQKKKKIKTLN